MKRMSLLLLTMLTAFGQVLEVDAGNPVLDNFFTGGATWKPGTAGYEDLGAPPWRELRYGLQFAYMLPLVKPGLYVLEIGMIEPNQSLPGKRRFTVAVNHMLSEPIDLVLAAGIKKPYTMGMIVLATSAQVRVDFRGIVGNAVVSWLRLRPLDLSDLQPGYFSAGSVRLGDGKFVDVREESHAEWETHEAKCVGGTKGVFRLVNGKFGLCWVNKLTGAYEWTNELPVGSLAQ